MATSFHCTLVTPQEQVLDEPVAYATMPAWDGQLGVAPSRAPMVVKLGDGVLRLDFEQGGSRWFFVAGGFAQMVDNKLTLLTPEAIGAEQVVRQDAQAALKEAEARVARTDAEVADKQRQIERNKQLIGLLRHINNGV